jgi:hypothetical protein
MTTLARLLASLTLLLALGATACQSDGTEPDYRPKNPPPAPQHTPRALEQGGHMGMGMSSETSGEDAQKLREGADSEEVESETEEEAP